LAMQKVVEEKLRIFAGLWSYFTKICCPQRGEWRDGYVSYN
jgi:hypothetical protein